MPDVQCRRSHHRVTEELMREHSRKLALAPHVVKRCRGLAQVMATRAGRALAGLLAFLHVRCAAALNCTGVEIPAGGFTSR